MKLHRVVFRGLLVFGALLSQIHVQTATGQVRPRVTEAVDDARRTTLRGNVHPLARAEFDRGTVAESQPMNRILLLLKRSNDQEAALQDTLAKQQDKSSPSFHQWLTPEQFGAQFGPADADIQAVTDWLTRQGFSVGKIYNGKTVIEFSGTAGQVQRAFGAAIHNYQVNGKSYTANATDPQIPAALAPVITGVVTLHNFPRQFYARRFGSLRRGGGKSIFEPSTTFPNPFGSGNFYGLGPGDFAKIYGIPATCGNPAAACNGTGQTIAIVGETNFNLNDVQGFRAAFGLPANFISANIILNGEDPGITSTNEETEADLDTQWSGAVAPGATIKYVLSASTPASQGVDLSALYIVDNNLAAVMSESYGACESGMGSTENSFVNNLWKQASAQGITVAVSTGDSGSAGCDDPNTETLAIGGVAVSGLASTPFNVAVGGTDFDQYGSWTTYWSATNNPTTQASALGYIPEIPWNQSCTQLGATGCNINTTAVPLQTIVAGAGGPSSQYNKPSWQIGAKGMPTDNKRDLPDISLMASPGFNGTGYLYCQSDVGGEACIANYFGPGNGSFGVVGGTSASAPAFAGIMALVNQSQATAQNPTPRQGNANYVLYQLANKTAASCASRTPVVSGCIFNDVTHGSSALPTGGTGIGTNSVACKGGTPDCSATGTTQIGVLDSPSNPGTMAWNVGAGYDLATGLGSLNIGNLLSSWGAVGSVATTTTLTINPTTGITHGSENVTVTISVAPKSGTATGTVSLIAAPVAGKQFGVGEYTLGANGSVTGTTVNLPGGTNYPVYAHYSGDGINAPSDSASQAVTVAQESSETFIVVPTFDPSTGNQTNGNATSIAYGSPYILRMYVTNSGGAASATGAPTGACTQLSQVACPSGTVALTDNGTAVGTGGGGPGVFNLNNAGYTRDLTPNLAGGTHSLVATYSGDTSYKTSTSATTTLTVVPAAMQLTLTVPTSTVIGFPAVIYMSGTTSAVGSAPMGTLAVYDGSTLLYSATGQGIGGWGGNRSGSGAMATAGFSIDTGVTLSGQGSHSLTMTYSGDPNYSATPTSPQIVHVVYPTTMQLQANATTINYGSSVTLTATVSTQQASPALSGQITFTSISGQSTIVVGPTTQTTVNGLAGLQATATATLPFSDSFSVNYSGDTNYNSASFYAVYIAVNPPDFNITSSQPSLTIPAGQSASVNIVVTPTFSLTSAVQFKVPTPIMQGITCGVSPAQVQVSGTSSATATLTCSVPAPSSSTSTTQVPPFRWPKLRPPNDWWKLSGFLVGFAIVLWLLPVRLRLRRLAYVSVFLSSISVVLGCGGGGGSGGGTGGGGGGPATPTSVTLSVPNTKVSAPNLLATVQVNGTNSPAGSVSLGVVGESWSFNTAPLVNGAAPFSYYLGAPGAFSMTANYSGDSRNLPSHIQTPLTVVQTGAAGNMTINVAIGPTTKQTSVTLTIQ